MFELEDVEGLSAKIKVIGVGGGGGNAVNNMIDANLFGVEFIAVNTDSQHLNSSFATIKMQIGAGLTKGLGAGSNPAIGRQAAIDDKKALMDHIKGADMVFITAGMGGGTGTGAAPVVASVASEMGILTMGVVTRPFYYEGRVRAINAEEGIKELKKHVDALVTIPNDKIHLVAEKGTPLLKSFSIANDILRQAVQGISDLILIPGLINLDFADVKSIIENAGRAVIGIGTGKGNDSASDAAKKAVSNPLVEESSIEGARRILINITGGLNMSLDAINEAASLIHEFAHDEATIIIGAAINPDMKDDIRVTVIATGLDNKEEEVELPQTKKWMPKKDPVIFKETEKILSKNIDMPSKEQNLFEISKKQSFLNKRPEVESQPSESTKGYEIISGSTALDEQPKKLKEKKSTLQESSFPTEDIYDIPTFLRKKTES